MKFFCYALVLTIFAISSANAADILVFAASSTTNALSEIARSYEEKSGQKISISFAGSSKLAKQIHAGAPADLFLSANTRWMDYLETAGLIEPKTRSDLLGNTLVLIQPNDDSPGISLEKLPEGLADGRLAVGDPNHVPAGIYAKQALEKLNLWPSLEHRLAAMPNVRAALTLVSRGETAAGIVYLTDALISTKVRVAARFPQASHQQIRYPVAIVKGRATPEVLAFAAFLRSADAVKLFTKHGFSVSN